MAIARGAGTEIIRCHHFENVNDTTEVLIFGEQHHIYTVLSVTVTCMGLNASSDMLYLSVRGYDSKAGTTNQLNRITAMNMAVLDTYVWNDKFSFNGHEPTDFTGPMDDATKQDAIADQGSSVAQRLFAVAEANGDSFEIHVTYIDQNNAQEKP